MDYKWFHCPRSEEHVALPTTTVVLCDHARKRQISCITALDEAACTRQDDPDLFVRLEPCS